MPQRRFDTASDPRIAFAIWSLGKLEELARAGKIPGARKEDVVKLLERLGSVLLKIRTSGYSKPALLSSQLFHSYNSLLSTLISRLGERWFAIAKRKDEKTAKLLRFVLFNLRTLGTRLKKLPDGYFASATKIRFVRVMDVKPHPRDPKLKVYTVTDWEMIYDVVSDLDLKKGDVVLFAHMPPQHIGCVWSEGEFLLDENGEPIRGLPEDVGVTPQEIPESVEKQIGTKIKRLLEEAFLI